MRLLGLDLETTGLDFHKDRITEIGLVLWQVEDQRPLETHAMFLYDKLYPDIAQEVISIVGITKPMLEEFGRDPALTLGWLNDYCALRKVDYVIAHNGQGFDKPMLEAEHRRLDVPKGRLLEVPWLDTKTDLPHPVTPESHKLKHLALDQGFINPFSHRAVFDALTMMLVLSKFDITKVIAYSRVPNIVIRAMVPYETRQLAKDRRYHWDSERKIWIKQIKEVDLPFEVKSCSFEVKRIE